MSLLPPAWVLLGCSDATRETLYRLADMAMLPTELVTIVPATAERNGLTNYADLSVDCEQLGVTCIDLHKYGMDSPKDVQIFELLKPSVMLVVGWQRMVPAEVLAHIGIAAAFHASPGILPYGRGRAPVNWTILEDRRQMALHLFELAEQPDAGDIIGIRMLDVNEYDNARSIYYKIAVAQSELIAQYIPLLAAGDCPRMRQRGDPRMLPKRTPEDGRIDWNTSADDIARLVRAVTSPFPGAFCERNGARVMVWAAQPFSRDMFAGANPGEVCFAARNGTGEFVVKCGGGSLLVTASEGAEEIAEGEMLA